MRNTTWFPVDNQNLFHFRMRQSLDEDALSHHSCSSCDNYIDFHSWILINSYWPNLSKCTDRNRNTFKDNLFCLLSKIKPKSKRYQKLINYRHLNQHQFYLFHIHELAFLPKTDICMSKSMNLLTSSRRLKFITLLLLILISASCSHKTALLEQIKSSHSGIHFSNTIV